MDKSLLRRVPTSQTLVGIAGWVLYVYTTLKWAEWLHGPVLTLAITFSVFPVLRFMRGTWEDADERIMKQLLPKDKFDMALLPIPSKRVARSLTETEELVWYTHLHPVHLVGWVLVLALATAGALASQHYISWSPGGWSVGWILAAIVWVPPAAILTYKALTWRHDYVCLTSVRLLAVYGLVTMKQAMMPLGKLTDETLQIPWHSRLLFWMGIIGMEYGTLILESAGQDQALSKIFFVPNATQVNRLIVMRALG